MMRRASALLHAKTGLFARKLSAAEDIVAEAFARCNSWYIALSGGKDSTVVLSLVRAVRLGTPAHHSEHEWMLPETAMYLDSITVLRRVAYQNTEGTTWARRWTTREAAEQRGARWLRDEEIATRGAYEDGVFLGLRADEASYRQRHLAAQGPLFVNKATGKWQCNPIAWWSSMDVWAYIYSRSVPYNAAYDRLAEIGVPLRAQRIGPFAVEGVLAAGQLATLKRGWPDTWNQYAVAHPEARQYA